MTPVAPVRIAVVDDHAVVARGLAADLTPERAGVDVVGIARTVEQFCALDRPVDVVVLDLQLRDGTRAGDNVRRVRSTGAHVLLFSAYEEPALLLEAIRAGARGYLNKARDAAEVADAVHQIMAGEEVISAEMLIALSAAAEGRPELSERQQDVLVRYTSTDSTLPAVARQLGMKPETLRTHLRRIKDKYAAVDRPVSTRLELYRRALDDGYVHRDPLGPL